MWVRRQQEKARKAARRGEFLAAVGGLDILTDSLIARLDEEFGELDMSRQLTKRTARAIADQITTLWIEAGERTVERTPDQFVGEQFAALVEAARTNPIVGISRWALQRKT
jgi:hypothetical protein